MPEIGIFFRRSARLAPRWPDQRCWKKYIPVNKIVACSDSGFIGGFWLDHKMFAKNVVPQQPGVSPKFFCRAKY
jgi:hypothetical protein